MARPEKQKRRTRRRSAAAPTSPVGNSAEEQIDEPVRTKVDVVRQHRASLGRLLALAGDMLDELSALQDAQESSLEEQARILARIVRILAIVIPLERQAFAVEEAGDVENPIAALRRQLFANARTFRPVEDETNK